MTFKNLIEWETCMGDCLAHFRCDIKPLSTGSIGSLPSCPPDCAVVSVCKTHAAVRGSFGKR